MCIDLKKLTLFGAKRFSMPCSLVSVINSIDT